MRARLRMSTRMRRYLVEVDLAGLAHRQVVEGGLDEEPLDRLLLRSGQDADRLWVQFARRQHRRDRVEVGVQMGGDYVHRAPTPGVVPAVNVPQPFRRDVRIDLGGGDVGVAEHRLDGAQVRPPASSGWRTSGAGCGGRSAARSGRQRPAPDPVPERLAGDRLPRRERNRSVSKVSSQETPAARCDVLGENGQATSATAPPAPCRPFSTYRKPAFASTF